MSVETGRERCQNLSDFLELLERHGSFAAARIINRISGTQSRPDAVQPVGLVRLVGLARLIFDLELGAPISLHGLELAFRNHAFGDKLGTINLHGGFMRTDVLVHDRLRERRLITLIVAEAAVAEHVDHHRLVEFHPVFDRNLGRKNHRFRIIAVAVEDRRFDHLGNVGRIGRGAREARVGRETNLVVDDKMHRTGNAVAAQARQAENFSHNALTRKRRIAMQQQRHHLDALTQRDDVAFPDSCHLVLFGAGLAHYHRVDNFKM